MLNKEGIRELAYMVKIDSIHPLPGYDRVESAMVGGWRIIVRKDQFKPGDYAIYFEIDSRVPEKEPFMFLEPKKFKIKTQKMCKSISQGLLMSIEDFTGLENPPQWAIVMEKRIADGENVEHYFLTKDIGVTYADPEDNKRKANPDDKYKKMAQRRPNIFKKPIVRWFMKRNWGKKLMFFLFGKRKDKKTEWPHWVVKTDEERCQNLPFLFPGDDTIWVATEKIDGTSTTFTMKGKKNEFYVCSRNVVFDKPDKKCFYDTNVYLEMAEKYNIEKVLRTLKQYFDAEFITIQGETYGAEIQKRSYSTSEHKFVAFNLIIGYKNGEAERKNPADMTEILSKYNIPCVPIVYESFKIPKTCDELLAIAEGNSMIDGLPREGLVFRTLDGKQSFKAVSNKFLLMYHY